MKYFKSKDGFLVNKLEVPQSVKQKYSFLMREVKSEEDRKLLVSQIKLEILELKEPKEITSYEKYYLKSLEELAKNQVILNQKNTLVKFFPIKSLRK